MPETFSSDLQGPENRDRRDRHSFNTEFLGASDSVIRKDRPSLIGGRGWGGILLTIFVVFLPVFVIGGWALWYFAGPIGSWLAGLGPNAEAKAEPETEPEPTPVVETPEVPAEPPVEKVFGIKGAPDGSTQPETPTQPVTPTQPETPTQPVTPTPPTTPTQPPASPGKIEVSTDVVGNVGTLAVHSRLAKVDEALIGCWTKAGATGPVELVLSFAIMPNGDTGGISVSGGNEALHECMRKAVPAGGWPKPIDGGDASATRTWKLPN